MWNLVRMPPWSLPANRTQTGLLTRSTKEGTRENANALRFEDRLGQEEVWLHAERDQRIEVEHDESHTVGQDRRKTVGNDETTAIGHDRRETVGNDETLAINRHQSIDVGGTKDEKVLLSSTEEVGGARFLTVGAAYGVMVGATKQEAVALTDYQQVGTDKHTRVGATYKVEVKDQYELIVGDSRLVMTSDGTITLTGKQINILAEGPMHLSGKDIEANPKR